MTEATYTYANVHPLAKFISLQTKIRLKSVNCIT